MAKNPSLYLAELLLPINLNVLPKILYIITEIIDKSIKVLETNRGGKITYHGPGQLICYFVLDLRKKKDIRKFINIIEKTITQTLKLYNIETFPDKENIGVWHKTNNDTKK